MSRITYCNPKLYIDGELIESLIDFSFTESMNNTLQSFSGNCSEPDLENRDLFNKKVNNLFFDLNCLIHPSCQGLTDESEMFDIY